ncbi:hypothetical protein JOQ06_026515 [Pogonophryne albipinna]|uniref:Uncharacterized protein n=1 Tax=Pogonophryne albipinna TaxID=1090488 RepID=A0AAD6BC68_9TELE|nr:hypothetical protein JOQ06_026515 [Pogonophryne albipinna]
MTLGISCIITRGKLARSQGYCDNEERTTRLCNDFPRKGELFAISHCRPDCASQQNTAPFLLWPRPTVLQGAEVSGRPTLDSVSATRNHPRHSTPPPGKLRKKMAASERVRME